MAIAVAFDDDLVVAAPQHRASPPALRPIHLIAETNGELAHINLPFESLEFGILAHQSTPLFPYCPFFFTHVRNRRTSSGAASSGSKSRSKTKRSVTRRDHPGDTSNSVGLFPMQGRLTIWARPIPTRLPSCS